MHFNLCIKRVLLILCIATMVYIFAYLYLYIYHQKTRMPSYLFFSNASGFSTFTSFFRIKNLTNTTTLSTTHIIAKKTAHVITNNGSMTSASVTALMTSFSTEYAQNETKTTRRLIFNFFYVFKLQVE